MHWSYEQLCPTCLHKSSLECPTFFQEQTWVRQRGWGAKYEWVVDERSGGIALTLSLTIEVIKRDTNHKNDNTIAAWSQ